MVQLGVALALIGVASGAMPLPNARQLAFMELETIQFMHFSLPTFWDPSDHFLRGKNPTVGASVPSLLSCLSCAIHPCTRPTCRSWYQATHCRPT